MSSPDSCGTVHELHIAVILFSLTLNPLVNLKAFYDDKSHHVARIGYSAARIMFLPDSVKHLIKRKQFCTFMVMNVNVPNGGENEPFLSGSSARDSTSSLA